MTRERAIASVEGMGEKSDRATFPNQDLRLEDAKRLLKNPP
ncbi:hypothetical protein [Coleofasciculus sp. FACHB-712]|nr:hypothetical protein [Coleofasciculus sp. FACHB-712]